jgi:hypothetical protein
MRWTSQLFIGATANRHGLRSLYFAVLLVVCVIASVFADVRSVEISPHLRYGLEVLLAGGVCCKSMRKLAVQQHEYGSFAYMAQIAITCEEAANRNAIDQRRSLHARGLL